MPLLCASHYSTLTVTFELQYSARLSSDSCAHLESCAARPVPSPSRPTRALEFSPLQNTYFTVLKTVNYTRERLITCTLQLQSSIITHRESPLNR